MKKIILFGLIILFTISYKAQTLQFGQAKGLFMGLSVGPRFPVGEFADAHTIGVGTELSFSYSDNVFLPVFFYTRVEYNHFPGNQMFYKSNEHNAISSNMISVNPGVRMYLPPILENIVILMPIVEIGASYAYLTTNHQFKESSAKRNYTDEYSRFGVHVGAGVSMFLLDAVTYYTYLNDNQFVSFNLKIRIPIYLKM